MEASTQTQQPFNTAHFTLSLITQARTILRSSLELLYWLATLQVISDPYSQTAYVAASLRLLSVCLRNGLFLCVSVYVQNI